MAGPDRLSREQLQDQIPFASLGMSRRTTICYVYYIPMKQSNESYRQRRRSNGFETNFHWPILIARLRMTAAIVCFQQLQNITQLRADACRDEMDDGSMTNGCNHIPLFFLDFVSFHLFFFFFFSWSHPSSSCVAQLHSPRIETEIHQDVCLDFSILCLLPPAAAAAFHFIWIFSIRIEGRGRCEFMERRTRLGFLLRYR